MAKPVSGLMFTTETRFTEKDRKSTILKHLFKLKNMITGIHKNIVIIYSNQMYYLFIFSNSIE